jgi:hypothetical protein
MCGFYPTYEGLDYEVEDERGEAAILQNMVILVPCITLGIWGLDFELWGFGDLG